MTQWLILDAHGKPIQSRNSFPSYISVAREVVSTGAVLPLTVWRHDTLTGAQSYDGDRTRRLSEGVRAVRTVSPC